jgi:hypothetical protein
VLSSSLVAPLGLRDDLHRTGFRQVGIHTYNSAGSGRCQTWSAGVRVRVHSATLPSDEALPETAVVVASCLELVMMIEEQMQPTMAVVMASLPPVYELGSLVHGTNAVKGPRSLQNDDLESEVRTWAETGSSAVQACQD